jgi:hypothetical protein
MNSKDKLKNIIEQTDELIQKRVTCSAPDFLAWKISAERYIISQYGQNSFELKEFRNINYSLSVFFSSTSNSEFIDACARGLKQAKAILLTFMEEEEDKGSYMKNKIDAFKKLQYEFEGIKEIIIRHTGTGYVSNLLDVLGQGIKNRDKDKIIYSLTEIDSWYDSEWPAISNDEFILNSQEHERNMRIIKEILEGIDSCNFETTMQERLMEKDSQEPIVLLSHSSSDKKYGNALEKLLSGIGIKNEQLIYTSHSLHKIPFDINIYKYLRESFDKKIFVIVLWSNEYLESPACMNELGALWVKQTDYSNIYVPSFDFKNPKYFQCAVDKNKMGAILDGSEFCKTSMIELKNKLVDMFELNVEEKQWIYILDQFIKEISL